MANSKNHHYIAQSVLSRFCYDGSKIYYFSKSRPDEGIASRDIGRKFRRRHYYSVETTEGKRSDILEREFFQVLDSRFAQFTASFLEIIQRRKTAEIDADTTDFLRQFIYYQTKRNPDFVEKLGLFRDPVGQVSSSIDEYEQRFGAVDSKKKKELLEEASIKSILDSARVRVTARSSDEVMDRLRKMSLHFAFAPSNKIFIIGSNPVVRLHNAPNALLGDGNVELWTPITPKVLLGFAGPNSNLPKYANIGAEEVRKINQEIVKASKEIGSSSEKLLQSLLNPR